MFRRLTIQRRLNVLIAVPLVLGALLTVVAARSLTQVRVGGAVYQEVVGHKDLVADLQPSSLRLTDADLLAHQIASSVSNGASPAALIAAEDRLIELESAYNERLLTWQQRFENTDPLNSRNFAELGVMGQDFWRYYHDDFQTAVDAVMGATGGNGAQIPTDRRRTLLAPLTEALERLDAISVNHDQMLGTMLDTALTDLDAAETVAAAQAGSALRRTALLGLVVVVLTGGIGLLVARSVTRPIQSLGEAAAGIPDLVEAVRNLPAGADLPELEPLTVTGSPELEQLATAFDTLRRNALGIAAEEAGLRENLSVVFGNLGHRNQNQLNRALQLITALEQSSADPALLGDLYRLDHLLTRMRRNAESLLVLAGAEPSRSWSQPVDVHDVIRGSLSEIEPYDRVGLTGFERVHIQGHAAADLSHLVAELVENAATFSPPSSPVELSGRYVHDGYLITVVDRGIGMTPAELDVANRLLSHPVEFEVGPVLVLGLLVASRIGLRQGIDIRLDTATEGGVIALVKLPLDLLVATGQHRDVAPPASFPPAVAPPAGTGVADPLYAPHAAVPVAPVAPYPGVPVAQHYPAAPVQAVPDQHYPAAAADPTTMRPPFVAPSAIAPPAHLVEVRQAAPVTPLPPLAATGPAQPALHRSAQGPARWPYLAAGTSAPSTARPPLPPMAVAPVLPTAGPGATGGVAPAPAPLAPAGPLHQRVPGAHLAATTPPPLGDHRAELRSAEDVRSSLDAYQQAQFQAIRDSAFSGDGDAGKGPLPS